MIDTCMLCQVHKDIIDWPLGLRMINLIDQMIKGNECPQNIRLRRLERRNHYTQCCALSIEVAMLTTRKMNNDHNLDLNNDRMLRPDSA